MILIVDDDPSVTAALELLLRRRGYETRGADNPAAALAAAVDPAVRLVLQDMNFSRETSGREGLELLGRLRAARPDVPVILITAWGSIGLAVEGMRAGAADFITKPWSNERLVESIETARSLAGSMPPPGSGDAPVPSRDELERRVDLTGLIGRSPSFLRVLDVVARVAPTDASVLVTGESGTGKELVAEAIHRNSRRRERPLVKVNLGGVSSTLFESEIFGHVRGAFTDATRDRKGRFEVADGGTIFLDEIGELDPAAQVKLLRVLQDRTYEVLGSSETRRVDVRVVSATNRDLDAMVADGGFREDLLYRLNLIAVRMPPLRERRDDVRPLATWFLERFAQDYGRPALAVDETAWRWLESREWPGNVRQLRQTLERAVLVLDGHRLRIRDLERLAELEHRDAAPRALPHPGSMTLDEVERAMVETCMRHYDGNVTRVAEALGLSRAALYRRLRKYGLDSR